MNTTTNHGAVIPLKPIDPPSSTPITDAHMKTLPFTWDYFDYQTEELLRKMETEIRTLREDIGKCHDVLGECRWSDTSELWKFFETHKQRDEAYGKLKDDYSNILDEFRKYKEAMLIYIGASRVEEALALYADARK